MKDNTYNGWTNRATWNAMLWLTNDEMHYVVMLEWLKSLDHTPTAKDCKAFLFDHYGDEMPDGENTKDVNFEEIAEAMAEDYEYLNK